MLPIFNISKIASGILQQRSRSNQSLIDQLAVSSFLFNNPSNEFNEPEDEDRVYGNGLSLDDLKTVFRYGDWNAKFLVIVNLVMQGLIKKPMDYILREHFMRRDYSFYLEDDDDDHPELGIRMVVDGLTMKVDSYRWDGYSLSRIDDDIITTHLKEIENSCSSTSLTTPFILTKLSPVGIELLEKGDFILLKTYDYDDLVPWWRDEGEVDDNDRVILYDGEISGAPKDNLTPSIINQFKVGK